jgi:hypothetical protein
MLLTRPPKLPQPLMGSAAIPVAVKGLNLRSGISALKPNEALRLDNWFPKGGYCQIRGGYTSHVTGLGASIGSLVEWAGPASRKMFGATATAIYDVSSAGAVGAAAVSSLNSAYWQTVNFTTSGGNFLVLCNGADSVRNFDGTTWTTPSITGVTSSTLINVASYKTRLWFVQKDTTKAWYLGTSSISGAATSLEMGDKFREGGKLLHIGSLSRDSGAGAGDVICFISSKGEIVAYTGSDPSDTNNWTLIGVYKVSAPIGNRALVRIDGDLALLTEQGLVSLRQVASQGRFTAERSSITASIDQGIIDDFASYGANTGWEMIVHPRTRQVIVNVPLTSSTATQYAMNIQTGAWCTYGRFASPLNATCWGMLSENLYFATSAGTVYRAENGYQDAGAAITSTYKSAFIDFHPGGYSRLTMVQPIFTAGGRVIPAIRISVDYRNDTPLTSDEYPGTSGSAGAVWDTSLWDVGLWGDSDSPYADWLAAQGIGKVAAVNMVTRTNGISAKLNAINVKYEMAKGQSL